MITDITALAPTVTPLTRPYWDGLQNGQLLYQHCEACGHKWLPPRAECPQCLGNAWRWDRACGLATLVSWVVFHRSYHAAFDAQVPYAVGIVQLAEGPRLIARIRCTGDPEHMSLDEPLVLSIQMIGCTAVPHFEATTSPGGN